MIVWLLSNLIPPRATDEPSHWWYAFAFEILIEAPLAAWLLGWILKHE